VVSSLSAQFGHRLERDGRKIKEEISEKEGRRGRRKRGTPPFLNAKRVFRGGGHFKTGALVTHFTEIFAARIGDWEGVAKIPCGGNKSPK